MSYSVLVDENFHYQDPESRWTLGTFDTAEDALAACRKMVDHDLLGQHTPGISAVELFARYQLLGDDPFIVPIGGAPTVEFSAWTYAEERCRAICG